MLLVSSRLFVFAVLSCGLAAAQPTKPLDLFDGRTLDGWEGNAERWRVEEGAITGEIAAGERLAKNEFLYWRGEAHDFDLTLEFRISGVPSANSGIQFRSEREPTGHAKGYQADLDQGETWLGRIYDEHGRALLVERGARVSIAPDGRRWSDTFERAAEFRSRVKRGDWNTYRILAKASHVEIWINGTLWSVLDDHQANAAKYSGLIALQLHSGPGPVKVQFRNVRLTHLGKTALPPGTNVLPAPAEPKSIKPRSADGKPLNLDLETGTLEGWTAEGTAFAAQPVTVSGPQAPRTLPTRHEGKFFIGYHRPTGDAPTGRLISTTFPVLRRWGGFLVGGGSNQIVRVEIVNADTGAVIKSASGNDVETLRREVVDLGDAKQIFVRLVDEASGGWGHIRFDDFVFYEEKPAFQNVHGNDPQRPTQSPVLWHLRPNPAKPTGVANAEAQKVMSTMLLTHGFQAELIAAEPDVHQPVAFAIDERGRLWIAEAHGYPSKLPEGQGRDRIIILEDRDGDGAFETRKVFAEKLNLVSGIEVGFGGVWVGAAPELLFIPDRDRDDRPDGPAQVLLNGWAYQDTHETLNSFTWGPDGWLYGNQGVFVTSHVGKPGAAATERQTLRAGVWRFHPTRHEFEIFAHGGSNQWGIDFNAHGHLFMTHCRSFFGGGGTSFVIRNGHFWNQANANYADFISNSAPAFAPALKNYLPASARYDSGEGGAGKPGTTAIYGGHSHVGTLIYLGDNWPDIYRDHLFTHNLHGHQLNQQVNVRTGSGYETFHAGYDLLHAPDPSYIAVDLQSGPDGAVYIIDWVDRQHCHTPSDEKWDRTNGRVYRVSWADTYKPAKVDLNAKSDAELAALHEHKSEWFVRTARRLLQERGAKGAVAPAALAALRQQARNAADAVGALRAFWTLHVIGALTPEDFAHMAKHSEDTVRAWAVQLATERQEQPSLSTGVLIELARSDASAMVRLAVASALPALPPDSRWDLVSALATRAEDAEDRFLPKVIWSGLATVARSDARRAMEVAARTSLPSLADSIQWYVARTPGGREVIARHLMEAPDAEALRGLRLLAFAVQSEATLPMPAGWAAVAERFGKSSDASVRAVLEQLSALFGDKEVRAQMRARLADAALPLAERRRAFELLKRVGDREAVPLYIPLLEHDAFRSAVIPLLSGTDDPAAAAGILKHFAAMNEADKSAALNTLTSRPAPALALLEAVRAGSLEKKRLTALHIRQMRSLSDPRVNQRLDEVWGKVGESSEQAKAAIAKLKQTYEAAPLWAFSAKGGEDVYQRLCVACHARGGEGGKLGPDLAGTWRNGVEYFLENIVDPNAVVGADFQLNIITKQDGTVISGMVEKQTESSLVVRTTTDAINVPLAEIKERQVSPQSLMPPGLLETLTEKETIELLKFLTTRS
jgi:putative membrane-bound dehydrogenase-like protein